MSLSEAVTDGKQWVSAAPDMTVTADRMEAKADRVTVHWTARGTNTGQGLGLSASGKSVVVHGTSFFRLANWQNS
jgi:predicted ester cyclase